MPMAVELPFPQDPIKSFEAWFQEAKAEEVDVPDAMQIATVGADGFPRVRTVLVKHVEADRIAFYTNLGSRKGQHLAANTRIAACFHWKSRARQVLFRGVVEPVAPERADAYWASRARGSQIGGWASQQSAVLGSREQLEAEVAAMEARFEGVDVPRPPNWSGFWIVPDAVELWQGLPSRLHDRWEFVRADGGWSLQRLYP